MLSVLRGEVEQLAAVAETLTPQQWQRTTPCPPWDVAGLLGHVLTTLSRLPPMLAAPAPPQATVSAAGYYRADARFSADANTARIEAGRAADPARFGVTAREVLRLCAQQPSGRVVRTRHGDPMLLTDFLLTRVVEAGVHGLDLASALDRPPWLTPAAAEAIADLHGATGAKLRELGWDRLTFVRQITGRLPGPEQHLLDRYQIRALTLG
jgi:uncharacterized protein (TIGR03083 family)